MEETNTNFSHEYNAFLWDLWDTESSRKKPTLASREKDFKDQEYSLRELSFLELVRERKTFTFSSPIEPVFTQFLFFDWVGTEIEGCYYLVPLKAIAQKDFVKKIINNEDLNSVFVWKFFFKKDLTFKSYDSEKYPFILEIF
jgi:hypothetical protein